MRGSIRRIRVNYVLAVLVALAVLAVLLFRARPPGHPPDRRTEAESRSSAGRNATPQEVAPPSQAAAPPSEVEVETDRAIEGAVFREGEPCAARVWLVLVGGPPLDGSSATLSEASTDPAGRFRLFAPDSGAFQVRARSEDGWLGETNVVWYSGVSGRREVRIDLLGGAAVLHGRAVHADGSPFRGTISATVVDRDGEPLATAPEIDVDVRGRFRFPGLPAGFVRLIAQRPGFAVTGPAWTLPREDAVTLVVDEGLTPIEGRVVAKDDGRPVAGAVVTGRRHVGGRRLGHVGTRGFRSVTDAEGRFEAYRELLPGRARAEGFSMTPIRARGDGPLLVEMSRPGRIAGRVVSAADGKGVAGAVVRCGAFRIESGSDGLYAFENLPLFGFPVYVLGRGWVSHDLPPGDPPVIEHRYVRVLAAQTVEEDLRVVPAARVEGRVTAADGSPFAGATVELVRIPPGKPRPGHRSRYAELEAGKAVSGPDGRFEVGDLVPGLVYTASVRAESRACLVSDRFTAGEDQVIDLTLPVLRFRKVVVISVGMGRRVANAEIQVQGGPAVLTGPDGSARLGPLPPGEVFVNVEHPGFVTRIDILLPARGGDPVLLEVYPGHVVAGRVVDTDGRPAAGAEVTVTTAEDRLIGELHATADGRFRLTGVPECDPVRIHAAWKRDGAWLGTVIDATLDWENHVLRLEP